MPDTPQIFDLGSSPRPSRSTIDKVHKVLTLRQLSKGGDFIGSVQCYPGHINIIHGEGGTGLQPFRDALLGRNGPIPVSMRYGDRELHASEVYAVGHAHYLWTEDSVKNVFQVAGVVSSQLSSLLSSFGLEGTEDLPPSTLGADRIRRLAIACSLFTQAKVILFDRPFAPITRDFCDRLGLILIDAIRDSSRIYVVTGLGQLPAPWKNSPYVRIETVDAVRKKTAGFSSPTEVSDREPLTQVRELLNSSRGESPEENVFRTRPQMILRPIVRATVPRTVQTEAIENPQLDALRAVSASSDVMSVLKPSALEPEKQDGSARDSQHHVREDTIIRKKPQNRLTQVSLVQRLSRRSKILRMLRGVQRTLRQAFVPKAQPTPLPLEARLIVKRKQQRNKNTVVQAVLAMLVVLLTLWCLMTFF